MLADDDFAELACTGLDEWRADPDDYRRQLEAWAARGVLLHCLNPDRDVIHCGVREACAGALADIYEALGGAVAWYGKPHAPIYAHALRLAGNPPLRRGAGDRRRAGDRHARRGAIRDRRDVRQPTASTPAQPFPPDFAARHGLGDVAPLATRRPTSARRARPRAP